MALIRMRGKDSKNWLLIKMKDDFASDDDITKTRPESVKKESEKKESEKKKTLKRIEPQLAVTRDIAPEGEGLIREIKHDGYRTMVSVDGNIGEVYSRNGKDWSKKLGFILESVYSSDIEQLVLDGETVLLNKEGVSSFSAIHKAMSSGKTDELRFYAFDLLFLNGEDLRERSQIERKKLLKDVVGKLGHPRVVYTEHFEEKGDVFYDKMREFKLEGLISKKKTRPTSRAETQTGQRLNAIKPSLLQWWALPIKKAPLI